MAALNRAGLLLDFESFGSSLLETTVAPRGKMVENIVYTLAPLAIAAVFVVLLFGLWNMLRGGSPNMSQKLMRLRVILQLVAIIAVMAAIWVMGR